MTPKQNLFSAKWSMAIFVVILLLAVGSVLAVGQTESVLYRFKGGSDGAEPLGGLVFVRTGNLYGTTCAGDVNGQDTVFQLVPQKGLWKENILYDFHGGGGLCPEGTLIFDQSGNLYGTTLLGGDGNCNGGCGTVFELSPNGAGWTETVLYSFQGGVADGAQPLDALVFDKAGNLYGTTYIDGAYGGGTVFQLAVANGGGWTESVIHSFGPGQGGTNPVAGLIIDDKGDLLGVATSGGTYNNGTVFKLEPPATQGGAWTTRVLHNFNGKNGTDGDGPYGALISDSKGNLYGTTANGGASGSGAVFRLRYEPGSGSWKVTLLYSFCAQNNCADGAEPLDSLVMDGKGNLYGTTKLGGSDGHYCHVFGGCGTVFELSPPANGGHAWTETVLYAFDETKFGLWPQAGLTLGKFGVLYGATPNGGVNYKNVCGGGNSDGCGTVFKVKP